MTPRSYCTRLWAAFANRAHDVGFRASKLTAKTFVKVRQCQLFCHDTQHVSVLRQTGKIGLRNSWNVEDRQAWDDVKISYRLHRSSTPINFRDRSLGGKSVREEIDYGTEVELEASGYTWHPTSMATSGRRA